MKWLTEILVEHMPRVKFRFGDVYVLHEVMLQLNLHEGQSITERQLYDIIQGNLRSVQAETEQRKHLN